MNHSDPSALADLHFDVVIVGAGLVGGAMACALAASEACQSLTIGLIEASPSIEPVTGDAFDPRVVALTHASQDLLSYAGIWPDIKAHRACAYTDMRVWDAEGTGEIHFDAREVQQPSLGHIVENGIITSLLWKKMQALSQVTLLCPATLQSVRNNPRNGSSFIQLDDGRSVRSQLLIAADGANSNVRSLLKMKTREWDYGHKAIVATLNTERPHQFTAWQRFLDTGPLAFLPMQRTAVAQHEEHVSSIVWSAESDRADYLMSLPDAQFCEALSASLEHKLGAVETISKRFCFPLRQRHAIDYILPGVALLGDAAHSIHPLAGQGVNLGFLDVWALLAELERAHQRHLPLSEPSILKRYQRNRKWHNLAMMGVMEGFKTLFGSNELPLRWARNEGMRRVNNLGVLKNLIVKQAMGL